jgi:hypothetical protein
MALKTDLKDPQYLLMKSYSEVHDDMPDGAFFALAEEMHGWDIDDWVWFSEVQKFDKDFK